MEDQYSIANAKNKLPSIIHSLENRRVVKLTRHGRPVAVLVSIKEYHRLSRKKEGFWNALQAFRNHVEKENLQITGEEFENLRDDSAGREIDFS